MQEKDNGDSVWKQWERRRDERLIVSGQRGVVLLPAQGPNLSEVYIPAEREKPI